MRLECIWEHNGDDTLLYASKYPGAFTRGECLEVAMDKMPAEINSYLKWLGQGPLKGISSVIVQEKLSDLNIKDADSDVIFDNEKSPLEAYEYDELKSLALRSAKDFLSLYESIPDKDLSSGPARKTFYGMVPRTAKEMYEHTKSVNEYYFAEIGVNADNEGDIFQCRKRGFDILEQTHGFHQNTVYEGSYGEEWSLRKVIRRFIWHDRIHAKAMYRMALKIFDPQVLLNPYYF